MLANLRALFVSLVDIMLLRRGPEHLPASPVLLAAIVALYLMLSYLAIQTLVVPLIPHTPANWPLQIVTGALVTLLWWRVAFQLARKPERFVQTMIAVFTTNTLFLAAMPLAAAMLPYMNQKPGAETAPPMLALLTSFIGAWALAVLARIVRSAFEWGWPGSFLFALASVFGPWLLLTIMFFEPPKSA